METSFHITILIIITVACGIGAQVLAAYLKVPAIVCLLLLGIAVGQDGLELVNPDLLGSGLEVIVSLFVALILFEGGLTLNLRDLDEVSGSVRNLVTVGTLITLLGGAIASHYWGEFPWPLAFLFASLIVVTGPTVIGPLLKQVSVERQVATILEGEGVLIDPVGAILAVLILNVVLNGDLEPLKLLADLLSRLLIGVLIGGVGGWLLAITLERSHFLSNELKNLTVLATLWGLFGLSETIRSESGLMTMVVIGLVLGATESPELRLLKRFKGQLTILAISVLFILLAADLSLASIGALGWGGLFTVLILMWVVRPLNVLICTWQSNLNWRQKLFMAWVGPRGIVSASIASLFAILLAQRGINGGDAIKALVFLTIMMTVLIQGLTAKEMARWLGITSSELTGLMMVGANPLSCLIGKLFQANGENVVIIDSDEKACALAEKEDLQVYCNSALNSEILVEAGLSGLGTFLAITNNT
ncbi:MAG: cation:proton antiporter, partial [Microcoleaceae cyanobacterium]